MDYSDLQFSPWCYRALKAVQSVAGMDDQSIGELIIYLGMEINAKGHLIRNQCVEVLHGFERRNTMFQL